MTYFAGEAGTEDSSVLHAAIEGSSRWFRCRNRLIAPHCRPRRYAYRF